MFANYTHYGKSSESLEGDHWADCCRDRGATVPPFNVKSRRSTSRIEFFSEFSASKMVNCIIVDSYCQLSYVFTGKILATHF